MFEIIRGALAHKDFIPEVPVQEEKIRKRENIKTPLPEPFERRGVETVRSGGRFQPQDIQQGTGGQSGFAASKENEDVQTTIPMQSAAPQKESAPPENLSVFNSLLPKKETAVTEQSADRVSESNTYTVSKPVPQPIQADKTTASLPEETAAALPESKVTYEQQKLAAVSEGFLTKDAKKKHKIIGQLFDTYWMVEYEDKLFIIDQHAAHEKVLYEKTMKKCVKNIFIADAQSADHPDTQH